MQRIWQTTGLDLTRQRWLIGALVLFFAAIFTQYALKLRHSDHGMRSALLRWRSQLVELEDGVNIWEKHAYPNPPMMAIILMPLTHLPPKVAATVWFGCKALFALAAILGVLSLLDSAQRSFPWWGKGVAVLVSLRPIEGDLMHGNVNLLILFLIVASLVAYCRRRDFLAGVFVGLAIACKLTPALFLLYFLWKRSWTALLSSVASLVVFTLVIPVGVFGWHDNLAYLTSWHEQMIAPYAAGVVSSEHKNQSLPGLAYRLLSEEPSFSDYIGDYKVVLETHNLVRWDRTSVQALILGCMCLYALLAMAFCRTPKNERPSVSMVAEYSVVILGMLLFSERTWKHHCVTLLLPFGVMAYGIATAHFSNRRRGFLGLALAICCLLMLSTSTGFFDQSIDSSDRFGKLAQVYGAYIWTFFLLLACMFVILRNAVPSPADEPGS